MFILNAFCCSSEEPKNSISVKSKSIRKVTADQSSLLSTNGCQSLNQQNRPKDTQKPLVSQPDIYKTTFVIPQSMNETVKSYEGSNVTSCGEQLSDKFVSPISSGKNSSDQKQNIFCSFQSRPFNGCNFNDFDVKQWSVKDVLKFLAKIGLKNYHNNFYKNKIKGKDLVSLSQKELKQDLQVQGKDLKTLKVYIQLLKEKVERDKRQKSLSKTFCGKRKTLSLYKCHSNTYSCRKFLNMVKNPIVQEESEEQNLENHSKNQNFTTKGMYSTTNFSQMLSN